MSVIEKGRIWLSPRENILDSASWNVFSSTFNKKLIYSAQLTLKVGKSTIVIHSSNSSDDHKLKRFKNKILLISEMLDYFLTNYINYEGTSEVNRVWLNDEVSSDKLFTGSCVTVLDKEECMFEVSSCDRANRWYATPFDQLANDRHDIQQLNLLKLVLANTIKAIDAVVRNTKPIKRKTKKV